MLTSSAPRPRRKENSTSFHVILCKFTMPASISSTRTTCGNVHTRCIARRFQSLSASFGGCEAEHLIMKRHACSKIPGRRTNMTVKFPAPLGCAVQDELPPATRNTFKSRRKAFRLAFVQNLMSTLFPKLRLRSLMFFDVLHSPFSHRSSRRAGRHTRRALELAVYM